MTHDITQRSRIRAALAAVLLAALATTLVTMFGARPAEAAFPGDNGKIVYEGLDLHTWNYEIYSVETDGSNPTPLTDDPDEDRMPAFSPDGTKIAFSTDRDGDAEVYSMNAADGSSATGVTDSPTVNADPDWQPLLDTTPPDVTLTAPSDGAAVSGPSVTLSAGASDTKRVARVDFYVGSRMVGTDSTAGGPSGQEYSASLNSTTLPDGPASVEAHAMKRVGGQRPAA